MRKLKMRGNPNARNRARDEDDINVAIIESERLAQANARMNEALAGYEEVVNLEMQTKEAMRQSMAGEARAREIYDEGFEAQMRAATEASKHAMYDGEAMTGGGADEYMDVVELQQADEMRQAGLDGVPDEELIALLRANGHDVGRALNAFFDGGGEERKGSELTGGEVDEYIGAIEREQVDTMRQAGLEGVPDEALLRLLRLHNHHVMMDALPRACTSARIMRVVVQPHTRR